jgi:hypothetical protein
MHAPDRKTAGKKSSEDKRPGPKFSVETLDRDLKLSARGAADGKKDFPESSAEDLCAFERGIVDRVDAELQKRADGVIGAGSSTDFSGLQRDLETLSGEPKTALAQFRAKKARAQQALGMELESAHADYSRASRDFRAFRIQHKLTDREPQYDTVIWRKIFWLALLLIVEVAANGWIIGQASPGGLMQGWTTALMISVMVVLTGAVLGAGPFRYLNYHGPDGKGWVHKFWAAPAMLAGGALLVLFAFYVAHYRYALAHSSLDAPAPDNILTGIATQPFLPFEQMESLMLFVIAILIGVFAVARGVHWDDPYPGYGARHRAFEEARDRTEDIAQELRAEIDAAKEAADESLQAIAKKSQDLSSALRRSIDRMQDHGDHWDSENDAILEAGRRAVDRYRTANEKARTTPPPAYFEVDPFDGEEPARSDEMLQSLRGAFSRATAYITACKSEVAGARAQLEAEYHSFYDDQLDPFLKGVAGAARAGVRLEFAPEPSAPVANLSARDEGAPIPLPAPKRGASKDGMFDDVPDQKASVETIFSRRRKA